MSETTKRPTFRVMAATVEGADRNGRPQLGNFAEVGAVWEPSPSGKWLPLNLNIVPAGLETGKVKIFLAPVVAPDMGEQAG